MVKLLETIRLALGVGVLLLECENGIAPLLKCMLQAIDWLFSVSSVMCFVSKVNAQWFPNCGTSTNLVVCRSIVSWPQGSECVIECYVT